MDVVLDEVDVDCVGIVEAEARLSCRESDSNVRVDSWLQE